MTVRPMPAQQDFLLLGSPIFTDPRRAQLVASHGPLAGWQDALNADLAGAAAGVDGSFAVAIHLPGGRVYLATDRFSICTMCYRVADGVLRFATRADELADKDTTIDPQAIFDYLHFHCIPSPRTIYKGIFRMPPGHYALFANGELTVAPYWRPHFDEQRTPSFKALQQEFRHLLQEAVGTHLDDSQPACFLSGGTDSSTVAGMAALASGRQPATYSIGFDAQGYDEMEFARLAARHFNTEHHEYYVTPDDLVRSIPDMAEHLDQPFGNSSVLPTYYCAKLARDNGVTKLLAGDGGDELFGGNSRYAKQRMFGWYHHFPAFLRKGVVEPFLESRVAGIVPLGRKAASYVEQACAPMPDRLRMYNLIMRLGPNAVLAPKLLAQVDIDSPLRWQRGVWRSTEGCSDLNRELAFDWRFTLAESDLPKVRSATGFAGVDVAFPLLDNRLLAFSSKLPTEYKLKGLQLRWFFKEALRGFLPDAIIAKKKQGFGLPFGVWANQNSALNTLARRSLESLANRGVVRADFIETLLTTHLPSHPGYFGEMVWILMMLEQWFQSHAPCYRVD